MLKIWYTDDKTLLYIVYKFEFDSTKIDQFTGDSLWGLIFLSHPVYQLQNRKGCKADPPPEVTGEGI